MRKLKLTLLIIVFMSPGLCFAQNSPDTSLVKLIKDTINTSVKAIAALVYEPDPGLGQSAALNSANQIAQANTFTQLRTYNTCQLFQTIYNMYQNDLGTKYTDSGLISNLKVLCTALPQNKDIVQLPEKLTQYPATDSVGLMSADSASESRIAAAIAGVGSSPLATSSAEAGNNYFDYFTFIAPQTYTTASTQYAMGFINLLGSLYNTPQVVSLNSLATDKDKKNMLADARYQKYQLAVRTYLAQRSLALEPIYHSMAVRMPQKSIAALNLTDTNGQPLSDGSGAPIVSQRQLERYIATHRINDPGWYQRMTTASSTTLARETLLVLANIQRSLYKLHEDNERMMNLMALSAVTSVNSAGQLAITQSASELNQSKKTK